MKRLQDMLDLSNLAESIFSTYTLRSESECTQVLMAILAELEEDINKHIQTLAYPEKKEDLHKPMMITRLPHDVRRKIVHRLDEVYNEGEILLKFSAYITLCTAVGDHVEHMYQVEYAKRYQQISNKQLDLNFKVINN